MLARISVLERAFELARSGEYQQCAPIARQLQREGYEQVARHFDSPSLKRQLLAACGAAAQEQ